MYTSSSLKASCTPFGTLRPRAQARMRSTMVVRAESEQGVRMHVARMGRICAPFAAAALLMVQTAPAMADGNPVTDSFENTLQRQKELGADKLDFKSFFNKIKGVGNDAKDALDATKAASDPSKAATSVPQKIPTFGKPIETSSSVGQIAQDAKNKLDPSKVDTAAQKVKETVGGVADKTPTPGDNAPGQETFKKTAKEGTKDNTGAGSNSNSQATATPAFADKQEEASLAKVEEFQKKAEQGNPDQPRLDPSLVEGEPEPGPAPGVPNKLPEQPVPEPATPDQLGKDSAGGKVQDTKRGPKGLDLFGGGPSGETPSSKAEELIEKAEQPNQGNILDFVQKGLNPLSEIQSSNNEVGSVSEVEAPQPSSLDLASEKALPESAPGDKNELPEQPAPEPTPPSALGQDSAGGETGSTKSGGGILDFFGGSSNNQSAVPQAKDGITLASNTMSHNSGFVYLLAEGLPAPGPTPLDEPEPEAAPGNKLKLPEQPQPESASYQTPQDSAGGKVQDSKPGGGILDFFGGSGSEDPAKEAKDNIQKAASNEVGSVSSAEIAQISEEEAAEPEASGADDGKATLIGVGLSIALEIAIFSSYPSTSHEEKH